MILINMPQSVSSFWIFIAKAFETNEQLFHHIKYQSLCRKSSDRKISFTKKFFDWTTFSCHIKCEIITDHFLYI